MVTSARSELLTLSSCAGAHCMTLRTEVENWDQSLKYKRGTDWLVWWEHSTPPLYLYYILLWKQEIPTLVLVIHYKTILMKIYRSLLLLSLLLRLQLTNIIRIKIFLPQLIHLQNRTTQSLPLKHYGLMHHAINQ